MIPDGVMVAVICFFLSRVGDYGNRIRTLDELSASQDDRLIGAGVRGADGEIVLQVHVAADVGDRGLVARLHTDDHRAIAPKHHDLRRGRVTLLAVLLVYVLVGKPNNGAARKTGNGHHLGDAGIVHARAYRRTA